MRMFEQGSRQEELGIRSSERYIEGISGVPEHISPRTLSFMSACEQPTYPPCSLLAPVKLPSEALASHAEAVFAEC